MSKLMMQPLPRGCQPVSVAGKRLLPGLHATFVAASLLITLL